MTVCDREFPGVTSTVIKYVIISIDNVTENIQCARISDLSSLHWNKYDNDCMQASISAPVIGLKVTVSLQLLLFEIYMEIYVKLFK